MAARPRPSRRRRGARRWLFTVAHNTYLNHQRGSRRRHALADRVRRILARAERVSPPSDDGIEVRDAIDNLTPELAEVVRFIHWDGLTVTEAAEVIGVSASTARARYQRARIELRDTLSVATAATSGGAHQRRVALSDPSPGATP